MDRYNVGLKRYRQTNVIDSPKEALNADDISCHRRNVIDVSSSKSRYLGKRSSTGLEKDNKLERKNSITTFEITHDLLS